MQILAAYKFVQMAPFAISKSHIAARFWDYWESDGYEFLLDIKEGVALDEGVCKIDMGEFSPGGSIGHIHDKHNWRTFSLSEIESW